MDCLFHAGLSSSFCIKRALSNQVILLVQLCLRMLCILFFGQVGSQTCAMQNIHLNFIVIVLSISDSDE